VPTFILMHKAQDKPAERRSAEVLRLGLQERRQDGRDLDYVPMPDVVKAQHRKPGLRSRTPPARPVAFK
jgi:hypothetical protein